MVTNNSATGGFLLPTSDSPLEGEKLEDFFHDLIVGCTGIDNTLVRPSWQEQPPNIPVSGTIWIAFHFVDVRSDSFPFFGPQREETGQLQVNEEFNVHCSVYGSGAGSEARAVCKLLRDNLMVPQNQESLGPQGMALIAAPSAPQPVPVIVKTLWLYRVDMDIPIRRLIVRNYDVKSTESAEIDLIVQTSDETKIEASITVTPEG